LTRFRALAQGQFVRYGQGGMAFGYGSAASVITGEMAFPVPHGAISPAQRFAMKVRRFMEEHGSSRRHCARSRSRPIITRR